MEVSSVDAASPRAPRRTANPGVEPIGLRRVSYTYPRRPGEALSDINVYLMPGETTVLAGPVGAGKSTIARLVMRNADPEGGQISCGGVDLREMDRDAWQSQIACIPQGLSPTELQQIAAAPGFLGERPLLIADEPSAHLDASDIALVAETLASMARGRTTLLITNEPRLIDLADAIYVIRAGRLVSSETGRGTQRTRSDGRAT
jgi:ABC-type multidrug transport system fused ATPase/permease subunit